MSTAQQLPYRSIHRIRQVAPMCTPIKHIMLWAHTSLPSPPNCITISSAVFAGLMVANNAQNTDRQTEIMARHA